MDKLGIFHANQTSMCLDPDQNFKREVGTVKLVKALQASAHLPFKGGNSFVDLFYFVFVIAILSCLCHSALWSPVVKMLTSLLSYI